MKKTNKIVIFILGVAVLAGSTSFWVYREFVQGPQDLTSVTVRLKWLHQAQFAGMYVAQEKGFYEEAGLAVELKEFEFGEKSPVEEVAGGQTTFGLVGAEELLQAVGEGKEIQAVAAIYQTSPFALATLKESDIQTPADFGGKILGLISLDRGQAQIVYQALLSRYDIDKSDVSIKAFGFEQPKNLREGNAHVISLYRTDAPYLFDQEVTPYTLILPERHDFQMYGDTLIVSESLIDENPDMVKRFVQATLQGWEYALANKEEALEITRIYENPRYQEKEREEFIFDTSIDLIKPTGGARIGTMNFVTWRRLYFVMESSGLLDSSFDIADVYTTEFLK